MTILLEIYQTETFADAAIKDYKTMRLQTELDLEEARKRLEAYAYSRRSISRLEFTILYSIDTLDKNTGFKRIEDLPQE